MTNEENPKLVNKLKKRVNEPGFWKGMALILFAIIILTQLLDISINLSPALQKIFQKQTTTSTQLDGSDIKVDTNALASEVIKSDGVVLPITWGDLGKQMIRDGVIDEAKFRALFDAGLANVDEQILSGNINEPIILTNENSRFMLDMLWAFGLANKNDILDKGQMMAKEYGGAGNFASTGGWSLAKGKGFDHYSKYSYVTLNAEQQALVEEVSSNIYRPCCGNSTAFPDCNHGMAMLGLLELMAANGANIDEMYKVALDVNAYWFPQTYIDLATYFKEQGKDWGEVDPKVVLGADYSSSQGYQKTRQLIKSLPKPAAGGGGCGA